MKQYIFTFEGGGWNTVWARNLNDAIKLGIKKYPNHRPIPSSFRLATDSALKVALSLFY